MKKLRLCLRILVKMATEDKKTSLCVKQNVFSSLESFFITYMYNRLIKKNKVLSKIIHVGLFLFVDLLWLQLMYVIRV